MPDDVFGDGYDPATMGGDSSAGGSDPMGGGGLQRLLTGLKGAAKPFALGAILGSTQGMRGALMAPVLSAMMQKKGIKAPIPGMTSTGAPDMAGPAGIPKILQEAQNSGVPMPGGDSMGPTAHKKGGSVRRKAIGGMAMPPPAPGMAMQRPMMGPPPGGQMPPAPTSMAAPQAQGMPMQQPTPAAAMRKGGSTNKKAFGGLMSNKFKMRSQMGPTALDIDKGDKVPSLAHHNYPKNRKAEMGLKKGGSTMIKKCAEGGSPAADKPGFKELVASNKAKKDEKSMPAMKRYMGGPIRQKHEMAMGKSAPTKQEPPKGTAERRAAGGSVRGWGAARSTGGCTIS